MIEDLDRDSINCHLFRSQLCDRLPG